MSESNLLLSYGKLTKGRGRRLASGPASLAQEGDLWTWVPGKTKETLETLGHDLDLVSTTET